MISPEGVQRFKHKMDAFKTAQRRNPLSVREKLAGFVLFVGNNPRILDEFTDREHAVASATSILNEQDTVIFLGKIISKIGDCIITKDQLLLTRKTEK